MTEKPLHVLVAEALGWTESREDKDNDFWFAHLPISDEERERLERAKKRGGDIMLPYQTGPHGPWYVIPRYDTDWAETGPLIEAHGINIGKHPYTLWTASTAEDFPHPDREQGASTNFMSGKHPLVAVCLLILELKKAGKL